MPLPRLELRNEYGLGDPELYRNAASRKEGGAEAILHGVAISGLVGILRQLGDVAEFGAEIFHDLHEQVIITSTRGQKMLSRIKKIEEAIPSFEDGIRRKGSYIDLAYETGTSWHADQKIVDSHLSYDDLPQLIMDSYEECRDPPRLYLLDKYDHAGNGACLKRYSDPSYFKRVWATSEPEKAQQIQKEKKLHKIKRKYSRLGGEIHDPISTSQCNSLESSARFAPPSNDDQSFSTENSSVSKMRIKSEVISGPQLLNAMKKLNCSGQVSETKHSVMPKAPEYDRFSVSNIQSTHDHTGTSQLHNDELVFDVDDDSHYDFLHWKSTSQSPSVIWDEKSELVKVPGLISSDATRDSNPLFVNSESSKVEEPSRTESLNQAKPLPIIEDLPRSSSDKNQFEEVNEIDNYVDALNTLESEAETDSEHQTKCRQSLSNMGHQKNEFGVANIAHYYANNYRLPSDNYSDVTRILELTQSTHRAGSSPGSPYDGSQVFENSVLAMSKTNAIRGTDDDQHSWSTDTKSESGLNSKSATSQVQILPSISISNNSSTKLWTNGNLLGLEPSKPVDISLANGTGESTQSYSLNNCVDSEKQNMANGQISTQSNSIGKVQGSPESLSLADQKILNSNPFLNRKYLVAENSSMKHSTTYIDHNDDESQAPSSDSLTASISLVHQTTKSASSKESEPCRAFSIASLTMEPVQNSESGSPRRNLVQRLQLEPSVTRPRSSTLYESMDVDYNQSEEKPLVDNQTSQTFFEQNLASQTFHEQSLMNKTDNGLLEKSISSVSRCSQNSSPPLEHMKISFHPMNSLEASNLQLELPSGCINERMDGNASPSFRLFSGCTVRTRDSTSESDDDTFCKSYPYSTEDLLSARSDSNSELWEQDDYSESKTNELSDDLRRISSSTASSLSYSGFKQMSHVDQEFGLKDICTGIDADSFQPNYDTNIPLFESLINQDVKYDSLSISLINATTLTPTELPPPPPLPPIQWRLVRPSYEISEDNHSNISQMISHFEDLQNQNPPAPTEIDNIIQWPVSLAEDGQYKKMQDNQKLDGLPQTHELDRREQLLHQIRGTETQHNLKSCEELKSQSASSEGVDEKGDLLHQVRNKAFNLRRTATSRPSFVTQPTTNDRVAAILEKANAIRQACGSSDEDDNDDDWSDG